VDAERRCVFAGEYETGRVTVHDVDSGRLIAELSLSPNAGNRGSCVDVCLVDDMLIVSDQTPQCLHFLAIESIAGLR
jgi:hypothetical protein